MAVNSPLVVTTDEKIVKEIKPEPVHKMSSWWSNNWRAFLAEILATTLLIFFGCMTCIPIDGVTENMPLYTPVGFGLIIVCVVQSFGHISGAIMNPAVAIAAVVYGKMTISIGIAYAMAECIGAIIGYGLLIGLSTVDVFQTGLCTTQPHASHSVFQTLGVEIAFTAVLGFISCSLWDPANAEKNETNSLKFGFSVGGLAIAGGPLAGASMNPARSLGPALWTRRWTSHWVYWLGPLLGGVISAAFYKLVWSKDPNVKEVINKREILAWTDNSEV